jgi:hypothetical protein
VGEKLYPDDWSKLTGLFREHRRVLPPFDAAEYEHMSFAFYIWNGLDGDTRRRLGLDPVVPDRIPGAAVSRVEYEFARELIDSQNALLPQHQEMFFAAVADLTHNLATGVVHTYTHPLSGGAPELVPSGIWETEPNNFLLRFARGQFILKDEFVRHPIGDHVIFVPTAQIEKLYGNQTRPKRTNNIREFALKALYEINDDPTIAKKQSPELVEIVNARIGQKFAKDKHAKRYSVRGIQDLVRAEKKANRNKVLGNLCKNGRHPGSRSKHSARATKRSR